MRTAIIVLLLVWLSFAFSASGASGGGVSADANPFGVDIDGKNEKPLDPALTQTEKDFLTKWVRSKKDGSPISGSECGIAMADFKKRWVSGMKNWADADVAARTNACADLYKTYGSKGGNIVQMLMELEIYNAINQTIEDYICAKDDDPNHFVARLESFSRMEMRTWRKYVTRFIQQAKYKDTTAQQKYQFVSNWLLPKVPSAAHKEIKELVDDLGSDAGVAAKPDDPKGKKK